ncbi:hypothetical protein AKJ08_1481 [Vulgatibacter incomptus]|uniref:Uncharacterized protein n=1 Tax=Vulgatibacter incomptus TaxID=1391653 RepID=A0A0K1PD97_9BACT|nr:hypothetical protein AKJ08_1481 [Vulgatibacter incomptus]
MGLGLAPELRLDPERTTCELREHGRLRRRGLRGGLEGLVELVEVPLVELLEDPGVAELLGAGAGQQETLGEGRVGAGLLAGPLLELRRLGAQVVLGDQVAELRGREAEGPADRGLEAALLPEQCPEAFALHVREALLEAVGGKEAPQIGGAEGPAVLSAVERVDPRLQGVTVGAELVDQLRQHVARELAERPLRHGTADEAAELRNAWRPPGAGRRSLRLGIRVIRLGLRFRLRRLGFAAKLDLGSGPPRRAGGRGLLSARFARGLRLRLLDRWGNGLVFEELVAGEDVLGELGDERRIEREAVGAHGARTIGPKAIGVKDGKK